MLDKYKPPKVIFHKHYFKTNPTLITHEFDVDVGGRIHHKIQPHEVLYDQQGFKQEFILKSHQVVSFPAFSVESFQSCYFDYGDLGNTTSI